MEEISLAEVLEASDQREVRPGRQAPAGRRPRSPLLEPLSWGLFSAGGFVAAFLLPAHVAVLGIAHAAGWLPPDALSYGRIHGLARNPLVKLYLLGLVALPLFHWAHRFRFVLHHQLGIHGWRRLIAAACYGTALAGSALAVVVLLGV